MIPARALRRPSAITCASAVLIACVVCVLPLHARQAPAAADVTFTRDIAPILQRSCQACHRPDSVAPMSLMTYEDVRPYAAAIKRRTSLQTTQRGVMPPWFIDKSIGI